MRRRKATAVRGGSSQDGRRDDLLGRRIVTQAKPHHATFQAVYDGRRCVGDLIARGHEESFAKLCRAADEKQRQKPVDPRIARARRLLADDISLDRAYAEIISELLRDRAADSTVEALMFSLRSGVAALGNPDTLRRLSECSNEQARAVAVRVQKFNPEIAPLWTRESVEVLLAVWSKIHGQDA